MIHEQIKADPVAAWPRIVAFIHDQPQSVDAERLIEALIYEHNDRLIPRLEVAASEDPIVRAVICRAHVGGRASEGALQFWKLKERSRLVGK